MEKLKFRVWLYNQMIYVKDDIYISFFNADCAVDWELRSRNNNTVIYKHDKTYKEDYKETKLMQTIGKKDINGNVVYEGDRVELKIGGGYGTDRIECYWEEFKVMYDYEKSHFMFVDSNGDSWSVDSANKIRVIGNIYEK